MAGDLLSNTLTISALNSGFVTVVTTDDTPTILLTIPVPLTGKSLIVTATIVATEASGFDSLGATITLTVLYPTGGDVLTVGIPTINLNTTSTANVTGYGDPASESAIISVIGVVGQTWNWSATYQYIVG